VTVILTPELLADLRKKVDGATRGPWKWGEDEAGRHSAREPSPAVAP
jgi:hypothetical protein